MEDSPAHYDEEFEVAQTPVRRLLLRRRRSRLPWIFLVYHRRRRGPGREAGGMRRSAYDSYPSGRRRNAGTSKLELGSSSGSPTDSPSLSIGSVADAPLGGSGSPTAAAAGNSSADRRATDTRRSDGFSGTATATVSTRERPPSAY